MHYKKKVKYSYVFHHTLVATKHPLTKKLDRVSWLVRAGTAKDLQIVDRSSDRLAMIRRRLSARLQLTSSSRQLVLNRKAEYRSATPRDRTPLGSGEGLTLDLQVVDS